MSDSDSWAARPRARTRGGCCAGGSSDPCEMWAPPARARTGFPPSCNERASIMSPVGQQQNGPVLFSFLLMLRVAVSLDNGAASLPLLGWNSWCSFGPCGTDVCTETQAMETIEAMESNGMRSAGYEYVTLDDCFAMRRNSTTGELFPSPELFPKGFGPVVDRAHAGGFQFGVYTSAGDYTCHAKKQDCNGTCNVGSLGHYEQDAKTYSTWSME